MLKDIDHVAIKVADIDTTCDHFADMGFSCNSIGQYDEVGMKIAFLGNGDSHLELLEVTDSSSPIVNDAPGIHHVGIKVKDIEATFNKMNVSEGFLVEGAIRQGAKGRIFFFRLRDEPSTLFECVEADKKD